jgi:hypothetical protein
MLQVFQIVISKTKFRGFSLARKLRSDAGASNLSNLQLCLSFCKKDSGQWKN